MWDKIKSTAINSAKNGLMNKGAMNSNAMKTIKTIAGMFIN